MTPVANARMYSVAPGATAAWRRLLAHGIETAGIAMTVIDHPPPAGLPDLWARPDLGCVLMCGWPFAQEPIRRPIVAAPVPAASWSEGQPVYRAEFVVAADGPYRTLGDVLGKRFAFNARHSHSGWNLPCAHLASISAPPFSELVGPFVTHQRVAAAVIAGEAEVASLDSLVLDLLRLHDPSVAARLRVVATTDASPIPLFVGADPRRGDSLGVEARDRMRAALLDLDANATGRALLAALALRRFAEADPGDYAVTLATERAAQGFVALTPPVRSSPPGPAPTPAGPAAG